VHITMLASKSEYFKAASCFGKEPQERLITLQGDDGLLVGLMLSFFYTDDYDSTSVRPDPHATELRWIEAANHRPLSSVISDALASLKHENGGLQVAPRVAETTSAIATPSGTRKRQRPLEGEHDATLTKRPRANRKGPGAALYHTPTPRYLFLHLQLWEIVDKYHVPSLQALCVRKFGEAAMYYSRHGEFVGAVDFVYEDMPDHATALREAVVAVLGRDSIRARDPEVQDLACYAQLVVAIDRLNKGRTP